MQQVKESVAANLKKYRKESNYTQRSLADSIGVAHNTISSWENGTTSIDMENLVKVCDLFGVSVSQMYGAPPIADSLTDAEAEFMKLYRTATSKGKDIAQGVLLGNQQECNSDKKGA